MALSRKAGLILCMFAIFRPWGNPHSENLMRKQLASMAPSSAADTRKYDAITNRAISVENRNRLCKLICICKQITTNRVLIAEKSFINRLTWNFGHRYSSALATHTINLTNIERCLKKMIIDYPLLHNGIPIDWAQNVINYWSE